MFLLSSADFSSVQCEDVETGEQHRHDHDGEHHHSPGLEAISVVSDAANGVPQVAADTVRHDPQTGHHPPGLLCVGQPCIGHT